MKDKIKRIIGYILCGIIVLAVPVLGYTQAGWLGAGIFTILCVISLVIAHYFSKLMNWLLPD